MSYNPANYINILEYFNKDTFFMYFINNTKATVESVLGCDIPGYQLIKTRF